MAKQTQELLLAGITLDRKLETPLYRQLYDSLRRAILQGQLRPGQRLPASRTFADELGVSRNTVLLAFDLLWTEGYLKGKTGSGTYVTDTLPEKLLHTVQPKTELPRPSRQTLSKRGQVMVEIPVTTYETMQPFQHGWPALSEFPFAIWNRITARQLRILPYTTFGYGDPAGYKPLRQAIATYLRMARAVRCEVEQIIIVNGSQQALDLAARILSDPGDTSWVEDPGYIGAQKALLAAGVKLVPVPIDEEGLNVEKGKGEDPSARLVHVTPSHQFPLGVTMSLERRLRLLEWASQSDAWILEDDYDSEYRYAGHPLSSLQGLDANNRVIYIGTFSKVLFPALRLGYLVVPPELSDAFIAAKALSDRSNPILEQSVLTSFMEEGHFSRHIRRMRLLYHQRQQILMEAASEYLKGLIEIHPSEKGMHEIGWLADGFEDTTASQKLAKSNITAPALSSYILKYKKKPGLVLGYAAFNEKEIVQSVRRMAEVLT